MSKSWRVAMVIVGLVATALWHIRYVSGHAHDVSAVSRDGYRLSLPYQLVRPEFTVDGNMWIRHAVNLLQGNGAQMRNTLIDNAPFGREIHWNSGYAWWIAGWGWSWQKATGLSLPQATEHASMWLNAPLLIGFLSLFALWAGRRWGWKIGVLVGTCMVFMPNFYEGFWPGYADHHGIIAASLLGLMLGSQMMNGGWLSNDDAQSRSQAIAAARWSGVWGGVALWISAASAVPAIALVAASSVAAAAFTRDRQSGKLIFYPAVWRAWGAAGAATSLIFYLLEYFPSRLGWRLEVNHPLYALAWLAGAELTARVMALLEHSAGRETRRKLLFTAAWALPLSAAPAVVIAIWKSAVFLPIDPFMAGLHRTIIEFQPQSLRIASQSFVGSSYYLVSVPILYLCGLVFLLLRGSDKRAMVFALGAGLPLQALGLYQARWVMSAGPGMVLVLVCLLKDLPRLPVFIQRPRLIRGATALLVIVSFGPSLYLRGEEFMGSFVRTQFNLGDLRQLIFREVAQVIRNSQPDGEVVLFGSPNTSVSVAFFGDFKTLGTLYWENLDGLKAAAEISSAFTDEEAARLIKQRGVTHLALFRDGNYLFEYAKLLHPEITDEQTRETFGYRLLGVRTVPVWLEALPYAAPKGLPAEIDSEVLVFKVNFDQKPFEAAYKIGILQLSRGETDDALNTFAQAVALEPSYFAAYLRRGEIFIGRKNWASAQDDFDLAVKAAPPSERYPLLTQAGISFFSVSEHARAIAYYERALLENVTNPIAANNLAMLYATAKDEKLRNPSRALELALLCVAQAQDNPALLDTLAAAHAASGDFAEAVRILTRATSLAQQSGASELLRELEAHLAAYREGRIVPAP